MDSRWNRALSTQVSLDTTAGPWRKVLHKDGAAEFQMTHGLSPIHHANKVDKKMVGLRHRICRTSHKPSRKFIGRTSLLHFIHRFWKDLFFAGADDAFVATGVCCFFYKACRLKRPLLKPVQYVIESCKHRKHNEKLVRNNLQNKKIRITTSHQRIQDMCFFLLTYSLAKRNKLKSSCANDSTGRIRTDLV